MFVEVSVRRALQEIEARLSATKPGRKPRNVFCSVVDIVLLVLTVFRPCGGPDYGDNVSQTCLQRPDSAVLSLLVGLSKMRGRNKCFAIRPRIKFKQSSVSRIFQEHSIRS